MAKWNIPWNVRLCFVGIVCLQVVKAQILLDSDDTEQENEAGGFKVQEEGTNGSIQRGRNIVFLRPKAYGSSTIRDRISLDSLKHPLPMAESHDLHEAYQNPLQRLSDQQLKTLLKKYNSDEANLDQLSREEMLYKLDTIIQQHNQQLLKPRLITNVNILAPDLTLNNEPAVEEKGQFRTTVGPRIGQTTVTPLLDNDQEKVEKVKTAFLKDGDEASIKVPNSAFSEELVLLTDKDEEETTTTSTTTPITATTTTPKPTATEVTTKEDNEATTKPTIPKPAFSMLVRKHKTIPEEKKIALDENGAFAIHDAKWETKAKNNKLHSEFIATLSEELQQMKRKYESMKLAFLRRLRRINERHMETVDKESEDLPPLRVVAAAAPTIKAVDSKPWGALDSEGSELPKIQNPSINNKEHYDQYAQPPKEIEIELHGTDNVNKDSEVRHNEEPQTEIIDEDKAAEQVEKDELNKNINEFFDSESSSIEQNRTVEMVEFSESQKSSQDQIEVNPAEIGEIVESEEKWNLTQISPKPTVYKVEEEIKAVTEKTQQLNEGNTKSKDLKKLEQTTVLNEVEFETPIQNQFNDASVGPKKEFIHDAEVEKQEYQRPFSFPSKGVQGYSKPNNNVKRIYSTSFSSVNSGNTKVFRKRKYPTEEAEEDALLPLNPIPEVRRGLIDSDLSSNTPIALPQAHSNKVTQFAALRQEKPPTVMDALKVFESELIAQSIWVDSAAKKSSTETQGEISAMELVQQLQQEHKTKHDMEPSWHHHVHPTQHHDHNTNFNQADSKLEQCDAVGCNFEKGDTCNWESSEDSVSPGSKHYYNLLRKRVHRQTEYVMRGWQNWRGRYRNSLTGIARAEVFSTENQHFAASYVKPHQRSTLSVNLNSNDEETLEFHAWEAARNVQLRVCCDSFENCVFETEIGVRRGSRKWKVHYATCPSGTKKVIFECVNHGIFQGACGIDNVRLLDQTCPEVAPKQFLLDSGDNLRRKRMRMRRA